MSAPEEPRSGAARSARSAAEGPAGGAGFGRSLVTGLLALAFGSLGAAEAHASDFSEPWKSPDRALVVDAYEYNSIDWGKLATDKRVVGFIAKGSDGMPPSYYCTGDEMENRLCRALWKRHAVARELFHTRRTVAKALGLEWGAYHLARPGNPIEQANNFLNFAEPGPDDLMALDLEGIDPTKWMSLADAETFVRHIRDRTGRYPVLYTNGITAKHIAASRGRYPLLSRLQLWYARYTPEIGIHFPMGNWQSYALWQFSASANCNRRSCPYRVPGTPNDIDVNVAPMTAAELRAAWPPDQLVEERPASEIAENAEAKPEAGTEERANAAAAEPEAAAAAMEEEVPAVLVPLPISRKAALAGRFELVLAAVDEVVEHPPSEAGQGATSLMAAKAAEIAEASLEAPAQGAGGADVARVPIPIARKAALKGRFELVFVDVELLPGARPLASPIKAFAAVPEPQPPGLFEYLALLKDAELQQRLRRGASLGGSETVTLASTVVKDGMSLLRDEEYQPSYKRRQPVPTDASLGPM